MSEQGIPNWLSWAREIQSMCQTGLAYSRTDHEIMRYRRLLKIAAEMVESRTGISSDELMESFSAQPGYATVKVDVRGAVERDSKILLVREKADGRWSMPGGWADVGEHPSRMVSREVFEESGLIVNPKKVVGIYDADRSPVHLDFYHAYKIIFLCELQAGEVRPGDETLDARFFGFDDLPPLSGYRTTKRHLADVRAHLAHPDHLTVFD
jgi:ADP-ribose pyrophosphatase YjhB (NUDIX family)